MSTPNTRVVRNRKFLARDFEDFLSDLSEYSNDFNLGIKDRSQNSVGGWLLQLPAYVGDVHSFYLDHLFHEMSADTAVESRNIERHLRDAGVEIVGASPAVVPIEFTIKVPATGSPPVPDTTCLPIVGTETVGEANNGTLFQLTDPIDFTTNEYSQTIESAVAGVPTVFALKMTGEAVSGYVVSETFTVNGFERFKRCTLSNESVVEILDVYDNHGNRFYEVGTLAQDTVFRATNNSSEVDSTTVPKMLEIIPAPYRFIKQMSIKTRLTTLTFGGGNAESLDDDIIPDPSEVALPLYGKRTMERFAIDPNNLLKTSTLGTVVPNSVITVSYRYGGGLSNNVIENNIRTINTLDIQFPNSPSPTNAAFVRDSVSITNTSRAKGGLDAPTVDDLKFLIPSARNAQQRMVTSPDVLARIYTLPTKFGRVYRALVKPSKTNRLSTIIHVLSKTTEGHLGVCPDSLKRNLSVYLNEFRLISSAFEVFDAKILTVQVHYKCILNNVSNRTLVIQDINRKLKNFFAIKHLEIEQPLNFTEIETVIFSSGNVLAVTEIQLKTVTGTVSEREYSNVVFDTVLSSAQKLVHPPDGGIFEVRYPDYDIIGKPIN